MFRTLGSAWGSGIITDYGFFLNNGLNLFLYGPNKIGVGNTIDKGKQPRALMTPILTYNKKSPCISRFVISYSHHNMMENMDYGLTELSNVILKLFTDPQLYESVIADKRIQYSPTDAGVCFESMRSFYIFIIYSHSDYLTFILIFFKAGFDTNLMSSIQKEQFFKQTNQSCDFHAIDLIMKKDHIIYDQMDTTRSNFSVVLFNK